MSSHGELFQSRIVTGDILKVLKRHTVGVGFDVVIADPPYNIGKDFGTSNDNIPMEEYVRWCEQWLKECFRLLADNGLIYVYGYPEILAHIAVKYPIKNQRWLVWRYKNKQVPSSQFWQRSHESILCLWKPETKRPILEVDQIREEYTSHYKNCIGRTRNGTKGRYSRQGKTTVYADNGGALPRDVLDIPALAGGAGRAERYFYCRDCQGKVRPPGGLKEHEGHDILKHPTQKPMALTERLIKSRIKANNGRILIPFAGSGSECVVAKSLEIHYLGVEHNPEYARFGRKWVSQCIV